MLMLLGVPYGILLPRLPSAVVKHNNPCGLAVGATVAEAHKKAHACDPMSAYGGVIAANSKVTMEMAESVRPIFTEVIVAPDYDADALELLQTKKKNLRILKVSEPPKSKTQFRQIDGGLLMQSTDLIDAPATIRTLGNWFPASLLMSRPSRIWFSLGGPSAVSSRTLS